MYVQVDTKHKARYSRTLTHLELGLSSFRLPLAKIGWRLAMSDSADGRGAAHWIQDDVSRGWGGSLFLDVF